MSEQPTERGTHMPICMVILALLPLLWAVTFAGFKAIEVSKS